MASEAAWVETGARADSGSGYLDGWAMMERLLTDLAPLADRLWLAIDDLHELGSDQAHQQGSRW